MEPNATMLPMTRNGGMSTKFRLRNPIAVVNEVRKTGHMFTRRVWATASVLSMPWRSPPAIPSIMCTE